MREGAHKPGGRVDILISDATSCSTTHTQTVTTCKADQGRRYQIPGCIVVQMYNISVLWNSWAVLPYCKLSISVIFYAAAECS